MKKEVVVNCLCGAFLGRSLTSVLLVLVLSAGCAAVDDPYAFEKSHRSAAIESDAMTQAVMGHAPARDQIPLTGPMGGGVRADGLYMDQHEDALKARLNQSGVRVERADNSIQLIMPGNITFSTDSRVLARSFLPILDAVADVLARFDFTELEISGHTDSRGKEKYNLKLSEQRAQAVAEYLRGSGISNSRITTIGRGEAQPVASNKTEEGRAQNRRVELNIKPRG